ncbi:SRPBCC domain-containing protein [Streptomyces sp. A7024]|uniref:SRPBCC domain-containing protein n=1 Tax=Streptomyces coryli TaxID=1128680 RepID=A0A6G4U8P9_9ACTN|nr:SRPBCC domain-containing protein [Streptomyces coryli]NGN68076.1 SRPBCC domain-containing protein [Streptomyces coryli]
MNDNTELHLDQYFAHPPAKVWRALTEPELIARWMMPGDFRLEVGHRYRLQARPMPGTGFSGTIDAEVLGYEPEKSVTVRWQDAAAEGSPADFTITWRLEAEGHGTRLFLSQSGFDPDDAMSQQARKIMGGGWTSMVFPALDKALEEMG